MTEQTVPDKIDTYSYRRAAQFGIDNDGVFRWETPLASLLLAAARRADFVEPRYAEAVALLDEALGWIEDNVPRDECGRSCALPGDTDLIRRIRAALSAAPADQPATGEVLCLIEVEDRRWLPATLVGEAYGRDASLEPGKVEVAEALLTTLEGLGYVVARPAESADGRLAVPVKALERVLARLDKLHAGPDDSFSLVAALMDLEAPARRLLSAMAQASTPSETCPTCDGADVIAKPQGNMPCPTCGGTEYQAGGWPPAPAVDDTGRETAGEVTPHLQPPEVSLLRSGDSPCAGCRPAGHPDLAPAPVPAAAAPTAGLRVDSWGSDDEVDHLACDGTGCDRPEHAAAPTDEGPARSARGLMVGRFPAPVGTATHDLTADPLPNDPCARGCTEGACHHDLPGQIAPSPAAAAPAVPGDERERTHNYLNVERCPESLGDAMRMIGRYTESEGGKSAETMQARTDLFDAYETWCQLDRPEGAAVPAERADEGTEGRPSPCGTTIKTGFDEGAEHRLMLQRARTVIEAETGTKYPNLLLDLDAALAARSVPVDETGERR